MKQILLCAIACFTLLFAQAQTKKTSSKFSLGVTAGLNFQNINGQDLLNNTLSNRLVPRLHAGVNAEVPLADDFYLQPGVLFATKGTKFESSNNTLNLSYVEVPVHLLYKPVLGSGRLLLGVGPYVGFAVGGSITPQNGASQPVIFEKEVNLLQVATQRYYRGFDAGGNLLFGYEMNNRIRIQLNAQLGMVNIAPNVSGLSNNNLNLRNTGFGLSAGYRF